MAYTINLSNGTSLVPGGLSDGTFDTSHSSITLIGKDCINYGQFLNDNLVRMLENFASTASPANPLKGQLWWDVTNNILRVYSGQTWKISTGATSSPYTTPPSDLSALGGDLWFDSTNGQLKVYSGSNWITVGPIASSSLGNTGAVPALITDTASTTHIVIEFLFSGTIYAILSKDTFSTYDPATPGSGLPGFPIIKAGLNFSTTANPVMGLSTQDTTANPNTLVQRDNSGSIAAGGIVGTIIVASQTVTTPILTASQSISAPAVSGTLQTASQPNITTLGNVSNLQTHGTTSLNGAATLNGSTLLTSATNIVPNLSSVQIAALTPSTGQLVYNTTAGTLQIYTGTRWGSIAIT